MPKYIDVEKRQAIYAHWIRSDNYNETARVFKVAANTVKLLAQQMPEILGRTHDELRCTFVRKTWDATLRALDLIIEKLPEMDTHELVGAFGVMARHATAAQFAPLRAKTPDSQINDNSTTNTMVVDGHALREAFREAQQELGADGNGKGSNGRKPNKRILPLQ